MSEPNANAIPSTRAANRSRTHKLTISAMLSGVAFLLMFIEFPIPALIPSFVKLDVSDLPEEPAVLRAPRHPLRLCR